MRTNAALLAILTVTISCQVLSGQISGSGQKKDIQEHFLRAEHLLETGQRQAAAQEFLAVLRIDPTNVDAHANLGVIAFVAHDYAGASSQFREALKSQPSLSKARALLGLSEEELGHREEARTEFEKAFPALKDRKLRLQVGLQLAQIYYQTGDLEKAVPVLTSLQQLDPTNPDVLFASYRTYSQLADQTIDALALVGIHSARMRQVIAENLIQVGDLSGAIAAYRSALKIDPQLPGIHLELGEAYLESESSSALDDAEREFQTDLGQNPLDAKAECGLGDIYLRRGNLEASLKQYQLAASLEPDSSEAHLGVGTVLLKMNQFERARVELVKAVQLNPDNALAYYKLSTVDLRLGKAKESESDAAAFQKLKSTDEELRDLYSEMRRPGSAQGRSDLVPDPEADAVKK